MAKAEFNRVIEPLVKEARKYKSADEFGKAIANLYEERNALIYELYHTENREEAESIKRKINEINNNPVYKSLELTMKVEGEKGTDYSYVEDILGNIFSPLWGNIYTCYYEDPEIESKLYNFYNQAIQNKLYK